MNKLVYFSKHLYSCIKSPIPEGIYSYIVCSSYFFSSDSLEEIATDQVDSIFR